MDNKSKCAYYVYLDGCVIEKWISCLERYDVGSEDYDNTTYEERQETICPNKYELTPVDHREDITHYYEYFGARVYFEKNGRPYILLDDLEWLTEDPDGPEWSLEEFQQASDDGRINRCIYDHEEHDDTDTHVHGICQSITWFEYPKNKPVDEGTYLVIKEKPEGYLFVARDMYYYDGMKFVYDDNNVRYVARIETPNGIGEK